MAEVAIGSLLNQLVPLLAAEARLLTEVHIEVREIFRQLEDIHHLLKDADKMAENEGDNIRNGIKSWVQELREVAFQTEDLVSEYTHHVAEQPPECNEGRFQECVLQIASFLFFCCSRAIQRHVLAVQIRHIKARFNKIHERGIKGGFVNPKEGSTHTTTLVVFSKDPIEPFHTTQEGKLVGIESAEKKLVDVLSDKSSQCTVVPVVGMGGSGKTTLAKKVYETVQGSFQCHAWIEVPHPYRREEILRTLIRELYTSTKASIPEEIDKMAEKELRVKLKKYLVGKKYLVIFDDVWEEDFWGSMVHALIVDKAVGRIMITTRKRQVADSCQSLSNVHGFSVNIHEMQLLPMKKAWELFCKRTFGADGCCPKGLEEISWKIVERCEGLPLAIVVVAGLLSTKQKSINEWRKFHASFSSELESNVQLNSIKKILSLSFYELPYYLKSCLLYFGMYPRRCSIRNGRLIRQWIAEGFVKAVEGKTLEEVAQEYMTELINRSLVEASELDVTKKARQCRVHDLIHEIILKKTKEVHFCQVFSGSNNQSELTGITRRLSIMINSSNNDLLGNSFSRVHSVIVFRVDDSLNSIVPIFTLNFKLLKVLDFEDAPHLDHLPEDIGRLFDLRYLSVRGTKVKMLPRSIAKLENLETLDVRTSFVYELPADMIKRLCKLRNIYALNIEHEDEQRFMWGHQGIKVVGGIGSLKALQKLLFIEVGHEGVDDLLKELSNLTQLRTMGILRVRIEHWRSLCGCIEKMELLESLIVGSASENEVVDLEWISSPPQFLRNINMQGRLKKLPEWFTQLQNTLVKLRLTYSMLEDDPLQDLQHMHNLLELHLFRDAYVGEQLCFKEGMFPKLKKLNLKYLRRLRSLIIEETALPMLEELYIGPCPEMTDVPSGLQHLKKLKNLEFHLMPLDFLMFQDFQTVFHVPQVWFSYGDEEGQTYWATLTNVLSIQQESMQKIKEEQEEAGTSRSITAEESFNSTLRENEGASTSGTTATKEDDDATSGGATTSWASKKAEDHE